MAKTILALLVVLGVGTAFAQIPAPKTISEDETHKMFSDMNVRRQQISNLLTTENKDVVKLLCVQDNLKQIDVAINAAEKKLPLSYSTDLSVADHKRKIIFFLLEKVNKLSEDAERCIGVDDLKNIDSSSVSMTVDNAILPDSVMQYSINSTIVEPPACSSCFK